MFEFTLQRNGHPVEYRGIAYRSADGDVLVMTENVHEIDEFRELLLKRDGLGRILVLAVALPGRDHRPRSGA